MQSKKKYLVDIKTLGQLNLVELVEGIERPASDALGPRFESHSISTYTFLIFLYPDVGAPLTSDIPENRAWVNDKRS